MAISREGGISVLEFEDFVYLDVPKTGSTYVRWFLRKFARSREVADHKHRPVEFRDEQKLYIISCRDPLAQYLSLYAFGCDGIGAVRRTLNRAGMSHFYDGTIWGFSQWMELFLTSEGCRTYLSGADNHPLLDIVGLQTLRFLTLAFPSSLEILGKLNSERGVREALKADGLMDVLLRAESLTGDLSALMSGALRDKFTDLAAARAYLAEDSRVNQSTPLRIDLADLSPDILSLVQQREWLFFSDLHYRPYV